MDRKAAEVMLSVLINKLSDCNIYMHHIWGNSFDTADEIRGYVFNSGIKVRYGRAMFFTVEPFENPTSSDLLDYNFAGSFSKMHTVIIAIPKITYINGEQVPFSNNIIPFDDKDNIVRNEKYLNPFDVSRALSSNKYIPKEFVFGCIDINGEEITIELNKDFKPNSGVEEYTKKIIKDFAIDENDGAEEINSKFAWKLDEMNLDVGQRDHFNDIEFNTEP